MLSGHGRHRMKPPHTGRSGRSLHRMNPVARIQCIHPVQCIHRTHSIHRKHCRRPKHRKYSQHSRRALHRTCCMHSTHPMRRMHRSRSVHLMHRSYALHRTHADHVPQRKHAAECFPLLVTHRHSQAASGSCTLRVFAVILSRNRFRKRRCGRRLPAASGRIRREGGFYRHMPIASCFFVVRKPFRTTKKPGPRRRRAGSCSEVANLIKTTPWHKTKEAGRRPPIPSVTSTVSGSTTSRIRAFSRCSAMRGSRTICRNSSSRASSDESCVSIRATLRRPGTSPGSTIFIGSSPVSGTTITRSSSRSTPTFRSRPSRTSSAS